MITTNVLSPQSCAGVFVCIVGSSGVGKDSLLAQAHKSLIDDETIVFPRRLVTRAKNEAEDHDTISGQDFDKGIRDGAFCLHWRAHGLGYALPLAVEDMVREGKTVVCNVSRSVVTKIVSKFPRVYVVLITAPPEVIAERLRKRGRETEGSIAERLERNLKFNADLRADATIINTDTVQVGADNLIKLLKSLS